MRILDWDACLILAMVSSLMVGCKGSCSGIWWCGDGVTLEFDAPITAKQKIAVTIFDDDASYTISYPTTSASRGMFVVQDDADAGGFVVSALILDFTPSKITYSVLVDESAIPVAQGSTTLEYQRATFGSDSCAQSCNQAKTTIPVAQ